MAGGAMMPGLVGHQRGLLPMAELLRHWAAIGEAAAFGQVHRVRRVAGDQNAFLAGPFHPVDGGHRREQRLRIGMARRCEQTHAVCVLNDPAHIHHRDAVTHVLHHAEVMADEQIGQAKVFLQFAQQVQDLRLHRHIQGGYGLIADN